LTHIGCIVSASVEIFKHQLRCFTESEKGGSLVFYNPLILLLSVLSVYFSQP